MTEFDRGRADLAAEIAAGLDEIADDDGSVGGADTVEYIFSVLARLGAVTTCQVCCCDYAAAKDECPFCEVDEDE